MRAKHPVLVTAAVAALLAITPVSAERLTRHHRHHHLKSHSYNELQSFDLFDFLTRPEEHQISELKPFPDSTPHELDEKTKQRIEVIKLILGQLEAAIQSHASKAGASTDATDLSLIKSLVSEFKSFVPEIEQVALKMSGVSGENGAEKYIEQMLKDLQEAVNSEVLSADLDSAKKEFI